MLQMTKDVIYKYIPKYIKGDVLDVGAGTQKYRKFIEKYVDHYYTLDIEGDVDYIADAKNMPIEDEQFDSVISFQMLEHVEEPEKVIVEMNRILKQNGIVMITLPFMGPEHSDPYDFQRLTVNGLKKMLEKYNFSVIEEKKYTGPNTVLVDFIKFSYFNPYKASKTRLKIGYKVLKILYKIAKFLDRNKKDSNIYGNSLCIAKKI